MALPHPVATARRSTRTPIRLRLPPRALLPPRLRMAHPGARPAPCISGPGATTDFHHLGQPAQAPASQPPPTCASANSSCALYITASTVATSLSTTPSLYASVQSVHEWTDKCTASNVAHVPVITQERSMASQPWTDWTDAPYFRLMRARYISNARTRGKLRGTRPSVQRTFFPPVRDRWQA